MKQQQAKKPMVERLSDLISEYQRYFAAWEDVATKCDAQVAMRTANELAGFIEKFDDFHRNLVNQANQLAKPLVGTTNDFKKLPINPASRRAIKAAKQAKSMSADAERLLGVFVAQAN